MIVSMIGWHATNAESLHYSLPERKARHVETW
jgi:hypothetical protein